MAMDDDMAAGELSVVTGAVRRCKVLEFRAGSGSGAEQLKPRRPAHAGRDGNQRKDEKDEDE
jgi:hypothetical protein